MVKSRRQPTINLEPKWDELLGKEQLASILNWYSQNKTSEECKEYFLKFAEKNYPHQNIDLIRSLPAYVFNTYGWVARILTNKPSAPEFLRDRLSTKLNSLLEQTNAQKSAEISTKKRLPNVQQHMREKFYFCRNTFGYWIDDFMLSQSPYPEEPEEWLRKHDITHLIALKVAQNLSDGILAELRSAYNKSDQDLVVAYSHLSPKKIKESIRFIENLVESIREWSDTAKEISNQNRKPRKKKKKPPAQIVSKLKFLKEHSPYKSIDPTTILGSKQLWFFNVKTRVLGVYVCDNDHGLSVGGTKIQNYSEGRSIAKKLRKPDVIIPQVLSGGKIALKNLLKDIRSKEKRLSGKVGQDVLLLRVI